MRFATGCALAFAILASPACYTWKRVSLDEALASTRVSLTLNNQLVVDVYGPKVYGNKVVGFVHGVYQEYPAADVKEAQMRVLSKSRTTALVGGSVVAFGGMVALLTGHLSSPRAPDYCDAPEHVDEPICVNP